MSGRDWLAALAASELAANRADGILPSESRIWARLLEPPPEARADRAAVVADLGGLDDEGTRDAVIRRLVAVLAFWGPERTARLREQAERHARLGREIAQAAAHLADLLERREAGCPDIAGHSQPHLVVLLGRAAATSADPEKRHRYELYLEPALAAVDDQFDSKYWPTFTEVLRALAAEPAATAPADPLSRAALRKQKHSSVDTVRACLEALDGIGIHAKDSSIARFVTLALDPDRPVSADSVRQQRRK